MGVAGSWRCGFVGITGSWTLRVREHWWLLGIAGSWALRALGIVGSWALQVLEALGALSSLGNRGLFASCGWVF